MATKTWAAPSAGNWNTASNWSPSGVPTDTDDVVFNNTSVHNCSVDTGTNKVASITINATYTGQITQNADLECVGMLLCYGKWSMNGKNLTVGGAFSVYTGEFKNGSGTLSVKGSVDISNASGIYVAETGTLLHRPDNNRSLSNPHPSNAFYRYILNDCCEMLQDCDETSSPSVDKSGLGRNGTWYNSLAASTTKPTLQYPNSRSISSASSSTAYDDFPGGAYHCSLPFSISLWVYPTQAFSAGSGCMLAAPLWYDPWFSWVLFGYNDNGANAVAFQNPISGWAGPTGGNLPVNQWSHIVGTVDSSGYMRLYINGSQVGSAVLASTWHSWAYFSAFRNGWNFIGHIDGIGVWSKQLNTTEISNLYNGKRGGISKYSVTLYSNVKVTNECRIVAGTLAFSPYTLECAGDFNNYGGVLTPGTGKLLLSGSSTQTVRSGSQPFNNVEVTNASAGGVTFEDAVSISGTLSASARTANILLKFATDWAHSIASFMFRGISTYKIRIRSTTDGVQHSIVGTNNGSQGHVDVKDSNLSVSTQTCCASTNSGNNSAKWSFYTSGIAYRSKTNASGTGTSVVINKPTGVVDGDVLIAFVEYVCSGSVPTCTAPAGWNELASSPKHGFWGANYGTLTRAYWKVASGEGSSYTWMLSASVAWKGCILAYSGVAESPIDVSDGNGRDSEPNATWNAPTVTLPSCEWVICAYGVPGFRTVSSAPADLTERLNDGGDILWIGDSNEDKPAGTYAPETITFSSNCAVAGYTIGLKPPGGVNWHLLAMANELYNTMNRELR